MMATIQERFGKILAGKKFLLTWTWHPKPLNTAVANSALLIATKFGMDVTLLVPSDEYRLDPQFLEAAKHNCDEQHGTLQISTDIEAAYTDVDFVYAKSWGAISCIGDPGREWELRKDQRHFMVDAQKMALTNNARFSHCLPLRRNVKVSDEVMDSDCCVAIDEAENRLHVQKAIMSTLVDRLSAD